MNLHIQDETSPLRSVLLGTAEFNGSPPSLEEAYDPKSIAHIKAGTYPSEKDMIRELSTVEAVFRKYDITVFRPQIIRDCNQIFTRDIAFVIEDLLIISNILPEREDEIEALRPILDLVETRKIYKPPLYSIHIEGGDVIVHNDYIFVGTYRGVDYSDCKVARTNELGAKYIQELFPNKKVISFDLNKSMTDPRRNALHLDCCFQPVGKNKAILHKEGFRDVKEYEFLLNFFGVSNVFHIDVDEMYAMQSNIFSISPEVVISEKSFTRLNAWLRGQGITVEEVPYAEISKQEGLLRCSTMPLIRGSHK